MNSFKRLPSDHVDSDGTVALFGKCDLLVAGENTGFRIDYALQVCGTSRGQGDVLTLDIEQYVVHWAPARAQSVSTAKPARTH